MTTAPAYTLPLSSLFSLYGTSLSGLSSQVALLHLQKYGKNLLPKSMAHSGVKILMSQFRSPLVLSLLVVCIFSVFVNEPVDALIIGIVLVINAVIGFFQEYQASRIYQSLSQMIEYKTRVIRDGIEQSISVESLVVGDIVALSAGDKVPADLRLFETISFEVDESTFTGESFPSQKNAELIASLDALIGDRKNMAYMGTLALKGKAKGIVTATGSKTELGMLSEKVVSAPPEEIPLQKKMQTFVSYISGMVSLSALCIIIVGLFLGIGWVQLIRDVAATTVATIPESLPILVTVSLAIGVKRMAKVHAVIRHLPVVETLGSATVICTDKTGTLTMDQLTLKKIHDSELSYDITGVGLETRGQFLIKGTPIDPNEQKKLRWLLQIGMLCNESTLHVRGLSTKALGDPTELALLVAGAKAGLRQSILHSLYSQKQFIPFESGKKYMATIHTHGDSTYLFLKGAPEIIFSFCKPDTTSLLEAAVESYSNEGLRVLACAYKKLEGTIASIETYLSDADFLCAGVCGLEDVPRHEVKSTIHQCKAAGIRVIMITGDHAATAKNIAIETGIGQMNEEVINGSTLGGMNEEALYDIVGRTTVFARVAPKDKLRIVNALKKRGEIVAVIGDGVNDAPALRSAHIGVAMGKKGTDLAREAADIVLLDDRFTSLVSAIKQGRIVFDNIRKACVFLIPTGFAAVLSVLGTMVMQYPIPYLPLQLLWINLVTNGIQGVAMAFEKGESGILHRHPLSPKEGILSTSLFWRSIIVSLTIASGVMWLYMWSLAQGYSLELARTIAVTTMVFFQFFQTFNARSEYRSVFVTPATNTFLFIGIFISVLAHIGALHIEPIADKLAFTPLTFAQWTMVMGTAGSVILVVEIDKAIRAFLLKKKYE